MNSVSSCSDDSDCIILVGKNDSGEKAADEEKCEKLETTEDPSIKIADCPPASVSVIEV